MKLSSFRLPGMMLYGGNAENVCRYRAVVLYSQVLKLSRPPVACVQDLVRLLQNNSVGINVWEVWEPETEKSKGGPFSDLVAVSSYDDPLTELISNTWLRFIFILPLRFGLLGVGGLR